jgi:hypothetical protein
MEAPYADLLKRVFEIDLEYCPNCGSELKIIAAILEQPVIEKIAPGIAGTRAAADSVPVPAPASN